MGEQLRNALPHRDAPFFRVLHIIVALLILLQIINSNLTESDSLGDHSMVGVVTWVHVISGFALFGLGFVMLVWMLANRGFRYYYSWLMLDFRGIYEDMKSFASLRLPEAHAGGVAALIQGLGVLALLGVALCGGLWFVLNANLGPSSVLARDVLHLHEFLTVFIETYFFAHGAMGLLHIYLTISAQRNKQITE